MHMNDVNMPMNFVEDVFPLSFWNISTNENFDASNLCGPAGVEGVPELSVYSFFYAATFFLEESFSLIFCVVVMVILFIAIFQ